MIAVATPPHKANVLYWCENGGISFNTSMCEKYSETSVYEIIQFGQYGNQNNMKHGG